MRRGAEWNILRTPLTYFYFFVDPPTYFIFFHPPPPHIFYFYFFFQICEGGSPPTKYAWGHWEKYVRGVGEKIKYVGVDKKNENMWGGSAKFSIPPPLRISNGISQYLPFGDPLKCNYIFSKIAKKWTDFSIWQDLASSVSSKYPFLKGKTLHYFSHFWFCKINVSILVGLLDGLLRQWLT